LEEVEVLVEVVLSVQEVMEVMEHLVVEEVEVEVV
jgi:hypothetical protein